MPGKGVQQGRVTELPVRGGGRREGLRKVADTPDLHLSLALIGWSAQVFSRHLAQWPTVGTDQVRPLCWCRSTACSESKCVQHGVGSASAVPFPRGTVHHQDVKQKFNPVLHHPPAGLWGPFERDSRDKTQPSTLKCR